MTIQEANERLVPLIHDAGFKAFHIGTHISSNPYTHLRMCDDDFILKGAWDDGWNEAHKYHLIHRGIQNGEES